MVLIRWGITLFAISISTFSVLAAESIDPQLLTVAENSDFEATATHEQVLQLCRKLAESPRIVLSSMGRSFEDRDMPLLVVSKDGVAKPADLWDDDRLVVFAMANIHAGEVCGKEALLMLARELATDDSGLLDELVVLLAPIYNADGNERFAIDHRTNQVGPAKGMGQRPNAQGLDLNRDNIKHESPEARALAQLITDWKPAICIDTHTTNGSYHRYTITYDGPRHPATPGEIVEFTRDQFLPAVGDQLEKSGYLSFFYGNFNDSKDRWDTYPDQPRYCTHYFGLRGTIGVLSEAYAYASYKDRVLATRDFVEGCLVCAKEQRPEINKLLAEAVRADQEAAEFAVASMPIALRQCEALGFEEVEQDGKRVATDTPCNYRLTYFGQSRPTRTVKRPFGYLIPATATKVIDNLKSHNIQLHRLTSETDVETESCTLSETEIADREYQGHRNIEVTRVEVQRQFTKLPAGSLIVPANQPMLGGLIACLLEPTSADGLCAWNFFDEQILDGDRVADDARFPVARILTDISAELLTVD